VDKDIRAYVSQKLANDDKFQKWQDKPVFMEIEKTLIGEAHGMYV
jgi:hypothetical protein